LRRKPPGHLAVGARCRPRYRVLTALANTPVPARTLCLCTDDAVIGTWFSVWSTSKDASLGAAHARLQPRGAGRGAGLDGRDTGGVTSVDYAARGLADWQTRQLCAAISRWSKQYVASETEKIEEMDRLMACCRRTFRP
jgi:aminoglycoside phosphotransferase (APT) family kinase protein